MTKSDYKNDPNWKRAPKTVDGFAALDASGNIIVNSVRITRDAVRLAAGECSPIPVKIIFDPERENNNG